MIYSNNYSLLTQVTKNNGAIKKVIIHPMLHHNTKMKIFIMTTCKTNRQPRCYNFQEVTIPMVDGERPRLPLGNRSSQASPSMGKVASDSSRTKISRVNTYQYIYIQFCQGARYILING